MNTNFIKYLFITTTIVLLNNGCKPDKINDPTEYNIAPEFKKYVDVFFVEAASRGIDITKENLIVKANNTSEMSDICGKCTQNTKYPTLQRTVEINIKSQTCWLSKPENDREALVFHELGHCLLGRLAHKEDTFADGTPKSIMVANNTDLYGPCIYVIDGNVAQCNKTERRKYYIDELFDEKTTKPAWAK